MEGGNGRRGAAPNPRCRAPADNRFRWSLAHSLLKFYQGANCDFSFHCLDKGNSRWYNKL